MSDEVGELLDILRKAGYETCKITGPLGPLIDIKEAIKHAPFHWGTQVPTERMDLTPNE